MTLNPEHLFRTARHCLSQACYVLVLGTMLIVLPHAQASTRDVEPVATWSSFKQIHYHDKPIRLHLLAGYGRAIMLPEAVKLLPPDDVLPGCDIAIDGATVEIYPRGRFNRTRLRLIGAETGSIYEFQVRASTEGKRRSLKIVVPGS